MLLPTIDQLDFETGVYRPPSEGGKSSLLIRITRNCPWNRCSFCAMYKGEKFTLRSPSEIKQDIDAMVTLRHALEQISHELGQGGTITREAAITLVERIPELNHHQGFVMFFHWLAAGGKTAFLQDANSLIMKTGDLIDVLVYLRRIFPSLTRVTSYARSRTLAQKSAADLESIRKAGLNRLHVGLESGDDTLLKMINKGVTGEGHIAGGQKALKAGFELSEYWMPGLGGRALSENHALNTARILNEINPHYIRSRPFRALPGTKLETLLKKNEFQMLTPKEQLLELKQMVSALELTSRVCFDHNGNFWKNSRGGLLLSQGYEGYEFPREKQMLLDLIEEGLGVNNEMPAFGSM
jgi:radical SAM superfamily enzyme YgiQ (UPF0313 family)